MSFGSIAHILHPISKNLGIGVKKHGQSTGYIEKQKNSERQKQLDDMMKEYNDLPTTINSAYTDAARRAGTWSPTAEFASGLQSEVTAGTRGAQVAEAARINALRHDLDNKYSGGTMIKGKDGWKSGFEEFKPEGLGQTQANATQDAIANAPTPAPEATASAPDSSAGASSASPSNAAASVQNRPTPTKMIKPKGTSWMRKAGATTSRAAALSNMTQE